MGFWFTSSFLDGGVRCLSCGGVVNAMGYLFPRKELTVRAGLVRAILRAKTYTEENLTDILFWRNSKSFSYLSGNLG